MKKLFLALILAVFAVNFTLADVDIDHEDRISNIKNGVCTWASIEMLARTHAIKDLYGLAQKRAKQADQMVAKTVYERGWHPKYGEVWYKRVVKQRRDDSGGSISRVEAELKLAKVRFKVYYERSYPYVFLKKSIDEGYGVVISVLNYPSEGDYHSVVARDYDDKKIYIVDPNKIKRDGLFFTWTWFKSNWDGAAIVVYPSNPAPNPDNKASKTVFRDPLPLIRRFDLDQRLKGVPLVPIPELRK